MKGKVIVVGQEQTGVSKAGKPWRKKEYVIETFGQYPKKVPFSVLNDKIDQYPMNLGDMVEIEVDADGREWQGKWYVTLTAWKIVNMGMQMQQPVQQPVYQQQAPMGYGAPQDQLPPVQF